MRLVIVGTAAERQELRDQLEDAPLDVVGEFPTLAEARASNLAGAAILLPAPAAPAEADEIPRAEVLTPREIEVLELVAEGLGNKAIAERLGISDQTVKFHMASISGKLGAANRTDAVRRGVRRGLVTL
jgi:DNA-binding NarL/FixJ family response regulator